MSADDTIEQQKHVKLAEAAIAFLESSLGKHLIARAEAEERAALEALATANPFEPDRIRTLQAEVWRSQSVQSWIAETITEGLAAQNELGEREPLPESSVRDSGGSA